MAHPNPALDTLTQEFDKIMSAFRSRLTIRNWKTKWKADEFIEMSGPVLRVKKELNDVLLLFFGHVWIDQLG